MSGHRRSHSSCTFDWQTGKGTFVFIATHSVMDDVFALELGQQLIHCPVTGEGSSNSCCHN